MMENAIAIDKSLATKTLNRLSFTDFEEQLRSYARENNVPIIFDDGLAFLEMVIRLHQPKRILEIGTAIGYSALRMNKVCNSEVYTIERDPNMYELASNNIKHENKEDKIHIIFKDALEALDEVKDIEFDLIFIDAAKAQYTKFFDIYTPLLSANGVVVCDNMLFHGLVEVDEETYNQQSRSVRGLIRKLNQFQDYLFNNPNYDVSLFNIGDGMAVAKKK